MKTQPIFQSEINKNALNDTNGGQVDIKARVMIHLFLTFPINELVDCLITSSALELDCHYMIPSFIFYRVTTELQYCTAHASASISRS